MPSSAIEKLKAARQLKAAARLSGDAAVQAAADKLDLVVLQDDARAEQFGCPANWRTMTPEERRAHIVANRPADFQDRLTARRKEVHNGTAPLLLDG